jgi:hypothetical protein
MASTKASLANLNGSSDNAPEEYLVRGAYLACTYGTHHRRLNLPRSHGVYIKDRDHCLMNAADCKPGEGQGYNIPPFGICRAPGFPRGDKPTVLLKTETKNPLTGEPYRDGNGRTVNAEENVKGCRCEAAFVDNLWQNTHSKTLVHLKGEPLYPALTTNSCLVCEYGGLVYPINSGQEALDPPKAIAAPGKTDAPIGDSSSDLTHYKTVTDVTTQTLMDGEGRVAIIESRKEHVVTRLGDKAGNRGFLGIRNAENNSEAFGGDQYWFLGTSNSKGVARTNFGSCGVIAAANMLAYLDKRGFKGIGQGTLLPSGAYGGDGYVSKESYMMLANDLYDNYITPLDMNKIGVDIFGKQITIDDALNLAANGLDLIGQEDTAKTVRGFDSIGVWPLSRYEDAVEKYASDHGLSISAVSTSNSDRREPESFERACEFIQSALKSDTPVGIYLTLNPSGEQYLYDNNGDKQQLISADKHYMAITQIETTYGVRETMESGGGNSTAEVLEGAKIVVSTWGGENEIDFKSIWNDSKMDEIADTLINANVHVPPGWLGDIINDASDALNPVPEVGKWIDENINGVYLTYFK